MSFFLFVVGGFFCFVVMVFYLRKKNVRTDMVLYMVEE